MTLKAYGELLLSSVMHVRTKFDLMCLKYEKESLRKGTNFANRQGHHSVHLSDLWRAKSKNKTSCPVLLISMRFFILLLFGNYYIGLCTYLRLFNDMKLLPYIVESCSTLWQSMNILLMKDGVIKFFLDPIVYINKKSKNWWKRCLSEL